MGESRLTFLLSLFCLSSFSHSSSRPVHQPLHIPAVPLPLPLSLPTPKNRASKDSKSPVPRTACCPGVLPRARASLYRPKDSACVESCNMCGWRRRGSNRGRGTVHAGEMPHPYAPSTIPPTRRSSFTVVPLCWNSGGRANGTILFLFPGWARRAPLRNLARDTPPDLFGAGSSMRDLCLTKYPLLPKHAKPRYNVCTVHTRSPSVAKACRVSTFHL